MPENCQNEIKSEEYLDYLVEFSGMDEFIPQNFGDVCFQTASRRYAVIYEEGSSYGKEPMDTGKIIPHCYGLLSSNPVLEATGVLRLQRQPNLSLYGDRVIVGFIDTGIDYSHPAFRGSDGKSRIISIWDQTLEPEEGENSPEEFQYGVRYDKEMIDRAIASEDPLTVVRSQDALGHGTAMAGAACGSSIENAEFAGVAPLCKICVVKCKEAKRNLRDYYFIDPDVPCYGENDIMLGIRYIWEESTRYGLPFVICIGMGTNQGSHIKGGALGQLLQEYGDYRGAFAVTAGGNEGDAAHHYLSQPVMQGEAEEVELLVGEGEKGFTLELWADTPDLYSIGLISPDGEYSGRTLARLGEKRQVNFLFANTTVYIEYIIVAYESGDECIRMRFRNPLPGVWKIRVFNDNSYNGRFNMWLPIRNFISDGTYFLKPNPDITLCDPSNNVGVITCSYYDSSNRSVVSESSRGFVRNNAIKPDFAAPGVDVFVPLPYLGNYPKTEEERQERARYGYRTGSSLASAVTAGCVALLAEWALIKRNDITMDTDAAKKYLIRGADSTGITIPSRIWGNGTLDIYGTFDKLRTRE